MSWPAGEAALVTGAASGIGLGVARALVAEGTRVALVDVDEARLAEAEKSLRDAGGTVLAVPFDISDIDRWETVADRAEEALGPVSLLCNVAGVNGGGAADRTPLQVWRWVYGVNIDAQFASVAAFLPRFKSRGGRAHVLNTASVAGVVPMAGVAAYASSKFASTGLSMVLREELEGTDIGVSLLIPGAVATPINFNAGEAEAKLLGRRMEPAVAERNSALLAQGADPDRVGEQVVEAVRQGRFVIVTHREWAPFVARAHQEIERAYEEFDGRHGPDPVATAMAAGEHTISS
ncbi:SDR family NAD(P)-dependent oxidoreductase [Streptomyces sp. NPDC048172]|uniref:SDR family NAD(P)-dependent oxidoreductase n=1 Tax=Streptomyces sp. NPDC048172 TaxID=3365505 RepID=UPI00371939CB